MFMMKRMLSLVLCGFMLLTMFPVEAFAAEGDVEQVLPFNDELESTAAVARIKSTVSSGTVDLTQDKISGKYAIKVTTKDEVNKSYASYTLANSVTFKVYQYSQIRLWVKPGAGAKWIKFITGSSTLIKSDRDGDGVFKVGQDLTAGKWNDVVLDLARTDYLLLETSGLQVQTNDYSTFSYDNVTSVFAPIESIKISQMVNEMTQLKDGQIQFNTNSLGFNADSTILVSGKAPSFTEAATTQADFQKGVLTDVYNTSNGDLELAFGNDLATLENDKFDVLDSTKWALNGGAFFNSQSKYLCLTPVASWMNTQAKYLKSVDPNNFVCEFSQYAGGGGGADGTYFCWASDDVFNGKNYYNLWIDEFRHVNDTSSNNLQLNKIVNGTTTQLCTVAVPYDVDNATWRTYRVEVNKGHVVIKVNGITYIDYTITDYNPNFSQLGFGGYTGAVNNEHSVDNVVISVPARKSTGTYSSPVLDVSFPGSAVNSSVGWNAVTPTNTSVAVETNLSLDGGISWQGWQPCTNGGQINGVSEGLDLNNAKLKYRVTLATSDPLVTPKFNDISLSIQRGDYPSYSLPGGHISSLFVNSSYFDVKQNQSTNILPRQRVILPQVQSSKLALSGDGKILYYANPTVSNHVYLLNLNTGENNKISNYSSTVLKTNQSGSISAFKDAANNLYYYEKVPNRVTAIASAVVDFTVNNDGSVWYYTSSSNSINRYNPLKNPANESCLTGQSATYFGFVKDSDQAFYTNANSVYSLTLTPAGWKSTLATTAVKSVDGLWANKDGTTLFFKTADGYFSYHVSTKALRKLDLVASTIVKVTDDNKLVIQEPNYKYQIYNPNTDTVKDVRPSDAKVPANANEVLFDVDYSGNKMAYMSTSGLATYYINGVQKPERYLLSFDAKNTWLTYKKGIWTTVKTSETPTEADFQKYGMTVDEVNALDEADFKSLYADGRQIYNFDVAVYFASVDPYITPSLKGITVTMKGGEPGSNGEVLEKALYSSKSQSFTPTNWRKIRKIYPVEIAPKEAEMYYFVAKDGAYKTYKNGQWVDVGAALLTNVESNWIDSTNGQGISQIGMTADELRAIPETALTQLLPASNITVAYAMKVQDISTAEYVSLISIDYVEQQFSNETVILKIFFTDGQSMDYLNQSREDVENFMEWLNERQYNRGPVFYKIKNGDVYDYINYYTIRSVKVIDATT